MTGISGPKFDQELWDQFLIELINGDADSITEWLRTNVHSQRDFAMVLNALPRFVAILVKRITADVVDELELEPGDETAWILERVDDAPPSFSSERTAQLVAAALNDDDDAISGIISAVLDAPADELPLIVARLIGHCRQAFDVLRARTGDPG